MTRRDNDKEVSDNLKESFAQVDSQLNDVKLQATTVASMQEQIHGVVAKQKYDLENVRHEVEAFVRNAVASVGRAGIRLRMGTGGTA